MSRQTVDPFIVRGVTAKLVEGITFDDEDNEHVMTVESTAELSDLELATMRKFITLLTRAADG